ncbi:MAG: YihA family ribosome biogenesis GTP-binding protein [Proteobacteria bacterium]|nr:YihA family ribosome biogenesis GTP-binding protein [Pseudomonadota bacterium]
MKITSAVFVKSAVLRSKYPKERLPEIMLVGRSNVGKSSLINTLINRKGLAKTSSTPGKTQTLNFYRINDAFTFVDLPGFGYAKVPREVKRHWKRMVNEYVECRKNIKGAIVVLDVRRDPGDVERDIFEWLGAGAIPVQTVLTKTDKLSSNKLRARVAVIKKSLDDLETGELLCFSSVTKAGRLEMLQRVVELIKA